jgi:hypothetical protein
MNMQLVILAVELALYIPPPLLAEFSVKTQSLTVGVELSITSPPPLPPPPMAVFVSNVQLDM